MKIQTQAVNLFCSIPIVRSLSSSLRNSPLASRFAKGVVWLLLGAVISRGLGLLSSIIVARILGKEGFGELGIIQSTVGMFGTFAGFGLGLTATKYVAEFRSTDSGRASRILALANIASWVFSSLTALVMVILAPWLCSHTLGEPSLTPLLKIAAIYLFLTAVNGAQTGALAGFEAFRTIAYVNLLVGMISFPLMVGSVHYAGLQGAVWALVVNMAFSWLLNHHALRRECRKARMVYFPSGVWKEREVLWKFSSPAFFSGLMFSPIMWVANALLVNQPHGYGEMGVFNATLQWRSAILFFPSTLWTISLPVLSNLRGCGNPQGYRRILSGSIAVNGLAALAVAVPIVFLSRPIMHGYGPDFVDGYSVLIVASFTAVLIAVNGVIGQAIVSMGKMWIGLLFNGLWGIVLIASTIILLNRGQGANGLASAYFISYCSHLVWQMLYIKRVIKTLGLENKIVGEMCVP